MQVDDCFYVGYISKTRGLKDEVQLYFDFADYQDLDLSVVFLEIDKKLVPFFVEDYKLFPNRTGYFYFADVDHIDQAKQLVRKAAYLPNDKRPERDPETFQVTDLKGYVVYDETHGELGEIMEINEFPQQDIAVVHYRQRELMFPLNDTFIVAIDQEQGTIHVDLPKGLIDIYSGE